MTGIVEAWKALTKKPFTFQSVLDARRFFEDINRGFKKEGYKSRLDYRIYGKGKNTIAIANVVTPRRKK